MSQEWDIIDNKRLDLYNEELTPYQQIKVNMAEKGYSRGKLTNGTYIDSGMLADILRLNYKKDNQREKFSEYKINNTYFNRYERGLNINGEVIDETTKKINELEDKYSELLKSRKYYINNVLSSNMPDDRKDVYINRIKDEYDSEINDIVNEINDYKDIYNETIENMSAQSSNIDAIIYEAQEKWLNNQEKWQNRNDITRSFTEPTLQLFQTWSNKSLNIFNKLSQTSDSLLSGTRGLLDAGLLSKTSLVGNLIGGLGIAGAGFSLIGGLVDIFTSDNNESTTSNENNYSSTQRANIVSSGPENVYVTNNISINNSGWIGQDSLEEYVYNEVAPIISEASAGVL